MHELPAGPLHSYAAVTMDPMANSDDAPELLDVDMEQIAWPATFVAARRLLRLEELQAVKSRPLQHPGDRRTGHLEAAGDLRTGLATTPQAHDQLDASLVQSP